MRLTGSQWCASARGSDITCVDFTFVTRCDCLYLLSILSIVLISVTSVYARINDERIGQSFYTNTRNFVKMTSKRKKI